MGNHSLDTIHKTGSSASLIIRVPYSSDLLNKQVRPETELSSDNHRGFRPDEWYKTGWEKLEQLRFLGRDGERTMAQASIAYLLGYDETTAITPMFCMKTGIDGWVKAFDVPKPTDGEMTRVEGLCVDNFDIDCFDSMDALRSSVDGDDIHVVGLDKHVAKGARNEAWRVA